MVKRCLSAASRSSCQRSGLLPYMADRNSSGAQRTFCRRGLRCGLRYCPLRYQSCMQDQVLVLGVMDQQWTFQQPLHQWLAVLCCQHLLQGVALAQRTLRIEVMGEQM